MKPCFVVAVSFLLFVTVSAGRTQRRARDAATPRGIITGPSNVAMVFGPSVTLLCRVEVTGNERIQWMEYGTDPNGALISDQNVILPGHPYNTRYALLIDQLAGIYDLYIYPTIMLDGTYYSCSDVNAAPPDTVTRGAQLVMLLAPPNCTTSLPPDGVVLEGEYHTAECIMYFKSSLGVEPLMTWTGPEPFSTGYTLSNTSVWSGVSFTVQRNMDAKMYTCKTNFTQKGFIAPDSADNIPTYTSQFRTQQIFVHWPPKNLYHTPDYPAYDIGTTITCYADAFPMATITWQSLLTGDWFSSQSFTTSADMVGNQTMRCHAENLINGIQYYADYFIQVIVKPPLTTPTPGVSTTTTAPPAESNCFELTGRWEASNPKAVMCIWIDLNNNGVLMGLFKNGTDTYYADIYGRAQVNTWDQGGFSAIWPGTLGVTGHVFECRRCYGTEILTLNQIQRSDDSIDTCGDAGVTTSLPQFSFNRVTNSPPCTSQPPSFY
jgi:hypothetical protein